MTYVIIVTYGDRKQFLEQILFFFNTYTSLQLVIRERNKFGAEQSECFYY